MMSKNILRRQLLEQRRSLKSELREQWAEQIKAYLSLWLTQHSTRTLGIYWPIHGEPDLSSLWSGLLQNKIDLALPEVIANDAPLRFLRWHPDLPMQTDRFKIPIPAHNKILIPDCILIPCVGFNQNGYRLGYGKGFYDYTLAHFPHALSVGIAYSFSQSEFTVDSHDKALHYVITEQGITSFIGSEFQ